MIILQTFRARVRPPQVQHLRRLFIVRGHHKMNQGQGKKSWGRGEFKFTPAPTPSYPIIPASTTLATRPAKVANMAPDSVYLVFVTFAVI